MEKGEYYPIVLNKPNFKLDVNISGNIAHQSIFR